MGLRAAERGAAPERKGPPQDAVRLEIRAADPAREAQLLTWLDGGLRGGRPGRLLAEYGPVLEERGAARHVLCRVGGAPASHALVRLVQARAGAQGLRIGMIGLVYTDPRFRGQGLARRTLEAAVAEIAAGGGVLAALWSEKRDFYGPLGFTPAGVERLIQVDAALCARARAALGGAGPLKLCRPREEDWTPLEPLVAQRPAGLERPPGWLARLAAAPDCEVRVARRERAAVAFAARGRGDDQEGVVHEWAGEPAAVLECVRALAEPGRDLWLAAGLELEPVSRALLLAGAPQLRGCLALVRVLDAGRLPGGAAALSLPTRHGGWPLWISGFDSI